MPSLPFLDDLASAAKLVSAFKKGLKVDQLWIDGTQVPVKSGSFKLSQTDTLKINCTYQRSGENQHRLEAVHAKGDNNDVITIDGNSKQNVKIKIKPDFDFSLGGVTVEAEATLRFADPGGGNRLIVISSEKL